MARLMINSGNPGEDDFMLALNILRNAAENLVAIQRLPKEIGGRVKWTNGLIWVRTGSNSWETSEFPKAVDSNGRRRWWPSDHVAADDTFEVLE